uniref:Small ribosomal subunit protein uS17 n=1 Tax=Accipiter nisus TaxID=211598 RepID=A0A8B9MW52_9AVES
GTVPQGWGAGAGGSRCRRGTVPRGLLAPGAGEVPCPGAASDASLSRLSQTERAYQKQPTIFQNKKRVLLGEGGKEKLPRYYKNIGLGFKTPKEAIEGTYIDKKCPFTGNVSIRGRILSGVVTKMKMQRTIVIRRDYLHYIRKYNRFEKRHKNMSVHLSPCFRDVQIGDIVTVGECRPLSKTVRFNVLKVTKAAGTKKQFQKF